MEFSGEVGIVTGGGSGIGESIAELLVENGVEIFILSRSRGEETAQRLGTSCFFKSVDVSDFAAVQETIREIVDETGRIDYLVNNAGITRDGLLLRMKREDWKSVIDVNLNGAYNCSKAVVRSMVKNRTGSILNISSVSGLTGNPGQANYAAAKAGLIGLTKTLAQELGKRGIRVNALAPGLIDTEMTADLPSEHKEKFRQATALGRLGEPGEVAEAAGFLLSDEAQYVTGTVLRVDGGLTID